MFLPRHLQEEEEETQDEIEDDERDVEEEEVDEDGEEDDEEEEEAEEAYEEEEEEEEESYVPVRNVEEDEEFDKAFRDMMIESIDAVKTHHKVGDLDRMTIPTVIPKAKNAFAPMLDDDEEYDVDEDEEESRKKTFTFKLLSRDNKGRVEARQLLVPEESPMALKLLKSEESEREERERLRERVLQYNALNEEEEYQRYAEDGGLHRDSGQTFLLHSSGGGRASWRTGSSHGSAAGRSISGGGSDSLNLQEFLAVADTGNLSGGFTRRAPPQRAGGPGAGSSGGSFRGRGGSSRGRSGGRGQGKLREFGRL